MARILLIDDMMPVRRAIAATLAKAGHVVVEEDDGAKGLSRCQNERFDLVITDIMMPVSDGTDVVYSLKSQSGAPKVISMSGGGAGIAADQALSISAIKADAVLKKPFENETLLNTVDELTRS